MDSCVSKEKDKKNNVITTVYSISRLVEAILKRDNENLKSIGGEHPEVQSLREKCKDQDAVVSTTACQAMVTLVESGVMTIPNTLSTFVAMLPYFSTHVGVTAALGQLLVLDMKMRLGPQGSYKCPFNLQSPQHPLVTVLKQKNDTWHDVINQIIFLCNHPEEVVRSNSTELVKPVVLYVLCDPSSTIAALPYRQHLWSLLMSLLSTQLLEICIPWLQVEDLKSAPALYHHLCSNSKLLHDNDNKLFSRPYLALALASLVDTLVTKGQDPRPTLKVLDEILQEGSCVFTGSCVTMILSNTLTRSPIIYTSALMLTCSQILSNQSCVPLAGQILAAALLPWLAYPSILTSDILLEAQTLLKQIESLNGISITEAPFTSHAFPAAHLSVRMYNLMGSWSANSDSTVMWLRQLSHMPRYLRSECSLLLGALLINESSSSAELSTSLSVLLELVNSLPELGTSVLTWLLYRLARERNPSNQLELLRALPLMGGQKENVTLVIHTLESLQGKIKMRPLLLNLYLRLWRHEPRCFPYLHKLLLIDNKDVDLHWEIAKAVTMKEICELRPSQHGIDMVPILSSVLNRLMMNHAGGLPSSLALEAITALCEAKVVDVATTWVTLAPRLSKDTRMPVVISLCKLLGLISEVRSSNKNQNKLFLEAQTKLWSYVTTSKHMEIIQAAFKALSQFSVDQLSLKVMPERFRQGLVLPPEYAKTPIDAARKPEDVLPYIPGECWLQLLSEIPEGTTLVKALFDAEVSGMRGALRTTGRVEPTLPRLVANSICLALISHVRKNLSDPDTAVVPCLQILAQPNLLPPCDWSFLSTLAKKDNCYRLCFSIAAVQASASPSARAVTENFVKALYTETQQDTEVLFAFTILEDLCKGVAPNILRPLIENALQTSLDVAQNKDGVQDSTQFCEFMKHIKTALMKEDIHEANRTLISILLEALLDNISLDNDEIFSCYAESVGELSVKFLERMSSPSVWWEITSVKLRKAIHIRSRLATGSESDTPLVWLNECIDATATSPREQDLLLHRLVSVLEASQGKVSSREWLLQLMGHVQAALTSSDKRTEAAFLCDIFTLAVIVLSGHSCLVMDSQTLADSREVRHLLLAQALRSLLLMPSYNTITSQVIEWLHHVVKSSVTGEELTKELYVCLQALRHTPAMLQRGVWNRIVTL